MELRQLEYFQAVSRLGGITKAADRLRVAQPSITVAIQKLEKELGITLFDRSQKNLILTIEGRAFLQRVDDILGRLDDTVVEMNDYRLLQRGSLKIGVPSMIGAILFPYIFAGFHKIHPQIELTVAEEGTMAIRRHLEQGELDVGVIITSNIGDRLAITPIATTSLVLCLPPAHPFGRQTAVNFSDLRDEPFILVKEDTYSRQLILQECAKHGFSPRVAFSSSQIETILGLVEEGVGVSFLMAPIAAKHPTMVSRPLAQPLVIQAGLAWHAGRYLSNAARAFIDFVKQFPAGDLPGA
jgi:DNA-binding transcriptional LysR family regulator